MEVLLATIAIALKVYAVLVLVNVVLAVGLIGLNLIPLEWQDNILRWNAVSWNRIFSTRARKIMVPLGTVLLAYATYYFNGVVYAAFFLYAEAVYYSLGAIMYRIYVEEGWLD